MSAPSPTGLANHKHLRKYPTYASLPECPSIADDEYDDDPDTDDLYPASEQYLRQDITRQHARKGFHFAEPPQTPSLPHRASSHLLPDYTLEWDGIKYHFPADPFPPVSAPPASYEFTHTQEQPNIIPYHPYSVEDQRRTHSYSTIENHNTRNRQPVEYKANPFAYEYLHPSPPPSNDEQNMRNIDALILFSQWQRRGAPPSSRAVNRRELAIIKVDRDTGVFFMTTQPWALLEPGVVVECVGDLAGAWRVTSHINKGGETAHNIWECDNTRQHTLVRVDDRYKFPPSLVTRMKKTFWRIGSMMFTCPNNKSNRQLPSF
ncbi:hypothetical protein C8R44DRAFT_731916 [Mycena epipterygia]|nr:hypothetical protein C8R44DRAFT_731916 [Mycena epipterygia]